MCYEMNGNVQFASLGIRRQIIVIKVDLEGTLLSARKK